jgi:hypothetical protein
MAEPVKPAHEPIAPNLEQDSVFETNRRISSKVGAGLFNYYPAGLIETTLESCAKKALPNGSPKEREDWKRPWREKIWRMRTAAQPHQMPPPRKTPQEWMSECKVHTRARSHERQAEQMHIERSVYFDLKAGRPVGDATYIKAAQYITERYKPCTALDLKPQQQQTD